MVDRPRGQVVTGGEAGVPRADDDRGDALDALRFPSATSTVTFVGLVSASNTAERFCDWATSASISCFEASASMVKVTLMSLKPLRTSRVGAEDAADVVRALDRRLDRVQLDAAVLRDRRHAGGQAAGQPDEQVLDRGDAVVRGREHLGMVGLEGRLPLVLLLLAESEVVLDRRRAVHAVLPGRGGPPGELGRLGRALQHLPRLQQGLDVDPVLRRLARRPSLSCR